MNQKQFLCSNSSAAEITICGADIPGFATNENWSVKKTTLSNGVSAGIELIEVDNGLQTVSILATRGMSIWKIQRDAVRFGWDSPVRIPVHPAFINLKSRNNLGWVEGFNELLCRCGLSFNGPPGIDEEAPSGLESDITLHGQIANLPAESVEVEFETDRNLKTIIIRGIVREASLFGPNLELQVEYRFVIGSDEIVICDTVVNRASRPAELELLYHINIGQPILGAGANWQAPIKMLAPRDEVAANDIATWQQYQKPTVGYAEQVYFCELLNDAKNDSAAMISNANKDLGFGITFDAESLPCFTLWKNTQSIEDGYCTGLEPATSYPNFKGFERSQGRVLTLQAGESWQTKLSLCTLKGPESVSTFSQKIGALQSGTEPIIHESPQIGYSPE